MIHSLIKELGLPKEIHFKVKGWTTFTIHFRGEGFNEYYSTTANCKGSSGQCHDIALEGEESGLAKAFWLRYEKWHVEKLKNIPLEELHNMIKDIEILKENYPYSMRDTKLKVDKNFKAKKIGQLANSGLSLEQIIERIQLEEDLSSQLTKNPAISVKMKI